jgi:hypothetical protein
MTSGETIAANFFTRLIASTNRPVKRLMREMFPAPPD